MKRSTFLAWIMGSTALLLAIDFGTKAIAEARLAGRPAVELAGGLVVLVFARNAGAFLSLGASFAPALRLVLLIVLPAAALIGLCLWLVLRAPPSKRLALVASLFLAGGFGNLVERVAVGSVRDFLNFGIGRLRTGILNVADLYLTAALVVVLFQGFKPEKSEVPEDGAAD